MDNYIVGCGSGAIGLALVPTIGLIISEVLGMSKGKSNGITHFIICLVKKIATNEKITSEDILQCLAKVEEAVDTIEEKQAEEIDESPGQVV